MTYLKEKPNLAVSGKKKATSKLKKIFSAYLNYYNFFNLKRFSNLTIQNATRNSWDKKIKMKLDKKHVKEIETRMKEDKK